eukprot:117339_1
MLAGFTEVKDVLLDKFNAQSIYGRVTVAAVSSVAVGLICRNIAGKKREISVSSDPKVVVISGCDSGFGYMLAKSLDRPPYKVVALCLTEDGCGRLENERSDRVQTLRCDITRDVDVKNIKTLLEEQSLEVYALVNNAGIACTANIEVTPMSDFRKSMEVNCFGHVAVTKVVLPFMKSGSRVINMISIAGRVSAPLMSAYACSKFAMEAFNDSLRREMQRFGIAVVAIEPMYMRTGILDDLKNIQKYWENASDDVRSRYGEQHIKAMFKSTKGYDKFASNPQLVVDKYVEVLETDQPKPRYQVGKLAGTIAFLTGLPDWVTDMIFRRVSRI